MDDPKAATLKVNSIFISLRKTKTFEKGLNENKLPLFLTIRAFVLRRF